MIPIQQDWMNDAVYRKAYERGLKAYNPDRPLTISVFTPSKTKQGFDPLKPFTFTIEQQSSIDDVVRVIQKRLPEELPYPYTLTSFGPNAKQLVEGDTISVQTLLRQWDATSLSIRMTFDLPVTEKVAEKSPSGLGSKLRRLVGRGRDHVQPNDSQSTTANPNERGSTQARASRRSSEVTAPPSYEDATALGR